MKIESSYNISNYSGVFFFSFFFEYDVSRSSLLVSWSHMIYWSRGWAGVSIKCFCCCGSSCSGPYLKLRTNGPRKNHTNAKTTKKTKQDSTSKRMVVLLIQGISERLQRVSMKHNITTAHKPHFTLIKHLVPSKDRNKQCKTAGCVYEISCKNCDFTYVGETGRLLGTRLKEHCKEA